MKKLLFLVCLLSSLVAHAQLDTVPKFSIGVRAGANLSDMIYSDKVYRNYDKSLLLGPDVGLYVRTRLGGHWSLRTDLAYLRKGVELDWCDINYQFSAYYLDLRLPIQYNFFKSQSRFSPYLMAGPTLGYALMGRIHYASLKVPPTDFDMTKGAIQPFDVGLVVGGGIDWTCMIDYHPYIFSLEAIYYLGFLNNYSTSEMDGSANILNPENLSHVNLGHRFHQGLGIALAIHVPNYKMKLTQVDTLDLEWTSSDYTIAEQIEQLDIDYDSIDKQSEAYAQSVEKTPVLEPKDCYTIDDILSMLEQDIDVASLKICLFDIKFAFDSYELTRGSEFKLNKIVSLLRLYPQMTIRVNGHTDSYGSDEYNEKLSRNRALEVSTYIISRGIAFSRVSYIGFGERLPIDTNETDEGRYRNRRVEIEILSVGPRANN